MNTDNLFADIPENLPDELIETITESDNIRIERIVSHGHCSDDGFWYDQEQSEWVVVLSGRARLEFDSDGEHVEFFELGPGDHLNIPAHCRHRLAWTDPQTKTVWLAIHY